jgi:predicted amidophosphoribosyltransferase
VDGKVATVWDALLDLAAGSVCVACGRPGRALCRPCRQALPRGAAPARPTPCPPGLLAVHTTGEYAAALRALVIAHKEHAVHGLAVPLGDLLAVAVTGALRAVEGRSWPYPPARAEPLTLVPVPSHPRVVRERGHDPLLRLTRRAATALRRDGVPVRVARPLVVVGRPRDQAGLTSGQRAANLAGRFAARAAATPGDGVAVLVDDVLTTGWTLRAAQSALEDAGWRLLAGATVAATRRRAEVLPPAPGVPDFDVWLPR